MWERELFYGSDTNTVKEKSFKNNGCMWPVVLMSAKEEEKEKNITILAKYHGTL